MPASIGVNLRVTGHCSQGGRKYMEDLFSVAYQQTEDERDLEYAFFGIYDGHGGSEAAAFAKEHLMDSIVKQRQFWSDNDEDVLKAIRNGYMLTHLNMWKELEKWPKTVTGLPSTAGTTASIAFIRRGKIYIGHVGDSAIVLGYQKDDSEEWAAKPLTSDHKPESTAEIERIQRCGGKVVSKAGVPRVVWNRPRLGHKGPIKKNTPMDEIPFLAVARSLGDLWSYNPQNDEFIVSPDPDVGVLTIDPTKFRCLIFGTDGLWNMISPEGAVSLVQATEKHNEAALVGGNGTQPRDWLNPSKSLVDHALERWSNTRMRADNTSVVTLMLDPPGPPRATVLRSRNTHRSHTVPVVPPPAPSPNCAAHEPKVGSALEEDAKRVPENGLEIMTRFTEADRPAAENAPPERTSLPPCTTIDTKHTPVPTGEESPRDSGEESPRDSADESPSDQDTINNYGDPAESYFMSRLLNRTRVINTLAGVRDELSGGCLIPTAGDAVPEDTLVPEPLTDEAPPRPPPPNPAEKSSHDDSGIQINEVSSSSPIEGPPKARARRPRGDIRPAPNDRVLRSHHEASVERPPRPATRQAATRGKPLPPPQAATDRVVILTRRAPPAEPKSSVLRKVPAPIDSPAAEEETRRETRATRSQGPLGTPLAQKITRSIGAYARELRGAAAAAGARAGNSIRAPGPVRRAPVARRGAARSKENLESAKGRVRSQGVPASTASPLRRRLRRADSTRDYPEVHSTTLETAQVASCAASAVPNGLRPRALRSRNETSSPARPGPMAGAKRPRCGEGTTTSAGISKVAKVLPERCVRTLGKRAAGPWAPALALRNRLRRRLAD